MKTVPDILRECASTYEERNRLYGDNYKKFGPVMEAIFPKGVYLRTAEDHVRFGVFVQCVSKLTRYSESMERGGHADSAHDLSVYAAMLEETTRDRPA